jgi:reactive intermediate/imine deaminase
MSSSRIVVATKTAPSAIGPYSQAIRSGKLVFLSGQIGLDPRTSELVEGGFEAQVRQAFKNLGEVATAAGGSFRQVAKLTLFLTDLAHFAKVNEIMKPLFEPDYPARSTVGVASLPKGALFEVEAVLTLD